MSRKPGEPSLKDVQIRQVDVHDDAELGQAHAVLDAALRFERPYAAPWPLRELAVDLRNPAPGEWMGAWAAWEEHAVVGMAWVWESLVDNTDKSWLQVCVDPQQRGRGVGSALAEQVVACCADAGRTVLLTESAYPEAAAADHGYRRFAERHGFRLASTEVHRVLDLPVADHRLDELAAVAAPRHAAYRLETFAGDVPEELLPSLCHVRNHLAVDAPTGEIDYEPEAETPELYRERQVRLREQGRVRLTTLAVAPGGEVVAYTDFAVTPDEPEHVHQWGTMVRRDHRGRRLGLGVKVRNLQALQRSWPGARLVHTGNADVNAHMIGINEALGFRVVELLPEFQRRVEG